MALVHLNSIAALDSMGAPIGGQTHLFVNIDDTPQLAQQMPEILERPGVDGLFIRKTGVKGRPFPMTTRGYTASFATAATDMAAYRALVNLDYGVQITYHSVVIPATFQVLSVQEFPPRACLNAVGVAPGLEVYHVVRFTLVEI